MIPMPQPPRNAGKGMKPITGYNLSNWYKNFPKSMGPKKPKSSKKKDK